jgi:glucosylceramidase
VVLVAVNGNTQVNHLTVSQGALHFGYDMPPTSVATFVWPAAAMSVPPTQPVAR